MRINRVYQSNNFTVGATIVLDKAASLHLAKVLRIKIGSTIELFNGDGHRYQSAVVQIERNQVSVKVLNQSTVDTESPLNLHLFQGVSRGDKMDLTLQKGVELGVNSFTPLITERCGVKLDQKRWVKKLEHWHKVVISACEQSGRDTLPQINPVLEWGKALHQLSNNSFFLDPHAKNSFRDLPQPKTKQEIQLWVGPEGGFSELEICQIEDTNIKPVFLGPRVLRTETAALAAVASINALWGDF